MVGWPLWSISLNGPPIETPLAATAIPAGASSTTRPARSSKLAFGPNPTNPIPNAIKPNTVQRVIRRILVMVMPTSPAFIEQAMRAPPGQPHEFERADPEPPLEDNSFILSARKRAVRDRHPRGISPPTLRSRRQSVLLLICETVLAPTQAKEMSTKFSGQNRQWAPLSRNCCRFTKPPRQLSKSSPHYHSSGQDNRPGHPSALEQYTAPQRPASERARSGLDREYRRATKAHGSYCPRMAPQCPNI